jgi:hypothetical protein
MSTTTTPDTFSVTGKVGDRDVTITWTDGQGFDDPTGRIAALIATGEVVRATPTGPYYGCADTPALVALLTAKQALDEVTSTAGTDKVDAELAETIDVPDGAVA